jgi:poly-gamma-glutamate synthase PgsB/CapB
VRTHYLMFLSLLVPLLAHLLAERYRHVRRLRAIPTRVVVNGIRGKSSITRLTFGALAADPARTVMGKTTGTAARMLLPNGREVPIRRRFGMVNVIEQLGVVRWSVRAGADTLVVECMAVEPALQELNQAQLIQADIVVICNVREDHLDQMGPTLDDVARSLARSMPRGGICVTAERDRWAILAQEAARRDCELHYAAPEMISNTDMAPFTWITFKENVACALAVAQLCGVPRAAALAGMYAAAPDPGVLRVDRCQAGGRTFDAVNLFAANDPASTLANISLLRDRSLIGEQLSVVINCRPDRVERNGQMGVICGDIDPARIYLIGTPTRSAARHVPPRLRERIVDLDGEHRDGAGLAAAITASMPAGADHALVMIGNIHGRGEELLAALHTHRGDPDATVVIPRVEADATAELTLSAADLAWLRGQDPTATIGAIR